MNRYHPFFEPDALVHDLYGADRLTCRSNWLRVKRLANTTFHSFHPTFPGDDLTRLGFDVDALVRQAVLRLRSRFPTLTIAAWGVWPDRLEVLADGERVERNVAIGYIKSTLSHRSGPKPNGNKSLWCSINDVVPLLTAAERLRCQNHLRRRTLSLGHSSVQAERIASTA